MCKSEKIASAGTWWRFRGKEKCEHYKNERELPDAWREDDSGSSTPVFKNTPARLPLLATHSHYCSLALDLNCTFKLGLSVQQHELVYDKNDFAQVKDGQQTRYYHTMFTSDWRELCVGATDQPNTAMTSLLCLSSCCWYAYVHVRVT